jgi:ABC-type dipeptide/oligopeptide/nickel transport system permease component
MVARAAGLPPRRILMRHALPNAVGPAITLLGVNVGVLLASAVMVEGIFGLPGIGAYLFNAVSQKDISAVLGSVVAIGVMVIISNFLVDMVQMLRDPRIRAGQALGSAQ